MINNDNTNNYFHLHGFYSALGTVLIHELTESSQPHEGHTVMLCPFTDEETEAWSHLDFLEVT